MEQAEQGLFIIYTGPGKGKTTAALGLMLRAWGGGRRCVMVQFIKQREAGEHRAAARLGPGLEIIRLGTGFVYGDAPPEAVAAARVALQEARVRLTSGDYDLVVLDEVFPALKAGLLTTDEIRQLLDLRPSRVHLVMTGRDAPPELVARADLVTEMLAVKHPYERGLQAQAGIEF